MKKSVLAKAIDEVSFFLTAAKASYVGLRVSLQGNALSQPPEDGASTFKWTMGNAGSCVFRAKHLSQALPRRHTEPGFTALWNRQFRQLFNDSATPPSLPEIFNRHAQTLDAYRAQKIAEHKNRLTALEGKKICKKTAALHSIASLRTMASAVTISLDTSSAKALSTFLSRFTPDAQRTIFSAIQKDLVKGGLVPPAYRP